MDYDFPSDENFWDYLDFEISEGDGDFSISRITRRYILQEAATIRNMGSSTWVDCGTAENLLKASLMALEKEIVAEY